jgi:hypothetical protein
MKGQIERAGQFPYKWEDAYWQGDRWGVQKKQAQKNQQQ